MPARPSASVTLPCRLKPRNWLKVKSVVGGQVSGQGAAVSGHYPAAIVHGADDARLALSIGLPVTLLSAPGAALYAGCGWWRALVRQALAAFPEVPAEDILDCGDGAGQALAALRIGQQRLVLGCWRARLGRGRGDRGGTWGRSAESAPPALDLAQRGARLRLHDWLRNANDAG